MSTLDSLLNRFNKSLLTKQEAARELNISKSTLDRLRKSGEIKAKRVGGGIFFTINEIALFLDS